MKMLSRRLPAVGSNGPSWSVSAFRIIPSPMPSPVFVNIPGAERKVETLPREGKFLALVTTTSAGPTSVSGGTRNFTWVGETKKICAARPLTVSRVPATFVVNTLADWYNADPNVTTLREAITDADNQAGDELVNSDAMSAFGHTFTVAGGSDIDVKSGGSITIVADSSALDDARFQAPSEVDVGDVTAGGDILADAGPIPHGQPPGDDGPAAAPEPPGRRRKPVPYRHQSASG